MKIIPQIQPLYHNYSMVLQSIILLSLSLYDYFNIAFVKNLQYTDFIKVSKEVALTHQEQPFPIILYCFLISKIFEWIDTILLIANSKDVILLHWWHHMTIVIAFYTGYYTPSVIWIGSVNSFIHIIMYMHYANVKGVRAFAKYLTILQIIQLIGGVYLNWMTINSTDYKYYRLINGFICLSYALLFLRFYQKKYRVKKH